MFPFKYPRTSQPQQPVGIDWGNPATAALRGTIHFANGGLYDAVRRVAVKRITQYGSGTFPVVTPHGIAIGANGSTGGTEIIGVQVYEAGAGMVCAIYIKDGSVTNAVKVPICINDYGTTWTGTGNNTIGMYWVNTAGERQITFFTRRNAGVEVSVTGVPDGLHYIGFALHENIGLQCFMDGKLVGSSAVGAQYTTGAVVTDTYNSQTLTSLGVGSVLLRAAFNQNVRPLHIQELTRNLWQIFAPIRTPIFVGVSAAVSIYRPSSDVTTTGWTGTPDNTTLFTNINEAVASDTSYITSPTISGGESIIFGLTGSLPAGTWDVRYRANFVGSSSEVKIHLLDGSNVSQGASGWQTVTGSYADYTASVTTTGTATRVKIEVQ